MLYDDHTRASVEVRAAADMLAVVDPRDRLPMVFSTSWMQSSECKRVQACKEQLERLDTETKRRYEGEIKLTVIVRKRQCQS